MIIDDKLKKLIKETVKVVKQTGSSPVEIQGNNIVYSLRWEFSENTNVSDFMAMCKDWAWEQGYSLQTMREIDKELWWYICVFARENHNCKYETSRPKSELEAVFRACLWIEKQKEIV